MEEIKKKMYHMSLKQSLILIFIAFVISIGILTSFTIALSVRIQKHVLDSRTLVLEMGNVEESSEGSISYKIGNQYEWSPLTVEQSMIYYGSIVGMIIIIIAYVVIGILLSASFYYRLKIKKPVEMLNKGITNITDGNLDFKVEYNSSDEMGMLCGAVERLAQELRRDKVQIWTLMEDRRALNASISHDLGTPITVIKGYLEYLEKNIPQGKVTEDILLETTTNMHEATQRLEAYIDCVRDIQRLDDIELCKKQENVDMLLREMKNDFKKLGDCHSKEINFTVQSSDQDVFLDKNVIFRVAENVVTNALRYAKVTVSIVTEVDDGYLSICIQDDGEGFSKETLENAATLFYTSSKMKGNVGLGLYISKVLSEKHGGNIHISNSENGGGKVLIRIGIK